MCVYTQLHLVSGVHACLPFIQMEHTCVCSPTACANEDTRLAVSMAQLQTPHSPLPKGVQIPLQKKREGKKMCKLQSIKLGVSKGLVLHLLVSLETSDVDQGAFPTLLPAAPKTPECC
uniref:Uncharacterized protein n=1 Tax=Micrurus corallinus TaxID=54390 RepID=A0A2D4EWV1_MICCO